jgi:hypothetical protein
VSHKDEKQRALDDARRAFDEHRHWPRRSCAAVGDRGLIVNA